MLFPDLSAGKLTKPHHLQLVATREFSLRFHIAFYKNCRHMRLKNVHFLNVDESEHTLYFSFQLSVNYVQYLLLGVLQVSFKHLWAALAQTLQWYRKKIAKKNRNGNIFSLKIIYMPHILLWSSALIINTKCCFLSLRDKVNQI